jgi:hypothetical protein
MTVAIVLDVFLVVRGQHLDVITLDICIIQYYIGDL